MAEIIFYCFSILLIIGAVCVVFANNPVKSVLSLVFCFLNATGLLLMIGAEFIAAILIIVYVGAVVVLFLFVVMTLSTEQQKKSFKLSYLPFFLAFVVALVGSFSSLNVEILNFNPIFTEHITNTKIIGLNLYTEYFLQFQLGGIILLVALIGVIVLSQRKNLDDTKKQDVWKQITTDPKDRITMVNKITFEHINFNKK